MRTKAKEARKGTHVTTRIDNSGSPVDVRSTLLDDGDLATAVVAAGKNAITNAEHKVAVGDLAAAGRRATVEVGKARLRVLDIALAQLGRGRERRQRGGGQCEDAKGEHGVRDWVKATLWSWKGLGEEAR